MQLAEKLYRDGKLAEAIANLQAYLRDHPSETKARNFLFELLCFAGEFERARKHLTILAEGSQKAQFGATYYLAALAGEVQRQAYYDEPETADPVRSPAPAFSSVGELRGACNGKPFTGILDMDTRLGAGFEFLASGAYHRMAFRNIRRLELSPATRVRDLYWLPATAETTEAMGSTPLEQILIPVLYPQSYLFDDDLTRLGRNTDWSQTEAGAEIPLGQRILLIGGEEVPILSIRTLEFEAETPSGNTSDG